jgi:hypothetical protein
LRSTVDPRRGRAVAGQRSAFARFPTKSATGPALGARDQSLAEDVLISPDETP